MLKRLKSTWGAKKKGNANVMCTQLTRLGRWTRWKWRPCDLQIRVLSSIQVGKSNSMLLFPCSTHMMTTWSDVDSGKKLSLRTSQYIKILAPRCIMHLQPIPYHATAISPQYGAIQHGHTSIIKVMQGFFLTKWLTPRMDLKLTWEGLIFFCSS